MSNTQTHALQNERKTAGNSEQQHQQHHQALPDPHHDAPTHNDDLAQRPTEDARDHPIPPAPHGHSASPCRPPQIDLSTIMLGPVPPPIPEGTYTVVISTVNGLLGNYHGRPTFLGQTLTIVEGPHAGTSIEHKAFAVVHNYGEARRYVSATEQARAIGGSDVPRIR